MSEGRIKSQTNPNIRLRLPCELTTEYLLPTIRRLLAHELVKRHGMSQVQAASILNVTQPAVSYYLRSEPVPKRGALEGHMEEMRMMIEELSEDILDGRTDQIGAMSRICALCIEMRNRGPICSIHGEEIPSIQPETCSLCIADLTAVKRRSLEEYEIVRNVRQAVQLIEGSWELAELIPEIGMNIAYAKPDATIKEEVVGVPGRIRPIGGRPRASNPPDFAGSSHVARAVLTLMRFHPSMRSAISLKFDWEVVEICKDLDLVVSFFDRSEEPPDVKRVDGRTIPWGVERAVKEIESAPDMIYDLGDIGKEPIIFLFGPAPRDVVELAVRVANKYAGRSSTT